MFLRSVLPTGLAILATTSMPCTAQDPVEKPIIRLIPMQLYPGVSSLNVPYPGFLQLHSTNWESGFDDGSAQMWPRDDVVTTDLDALVEVLDHSYKIFDREVEVSGYTDFVRIRGSEAMVSQVASALGKLHSLVRPTVDVEVAVYSITDDLDDALLPTVLSPGQLVELQGSASLLWSGRTTSSISRLIHIGSLEEKPFICDQEIEVAKEAQIGDPQVRSLICGISTTLEIEPAVSGDGLILFGDVFFNRGSVGDRYYSLGLDFAGMIDAPRLRESRATVSARIENGGAMAIWSLGASEHSPDFVMTISARREGVPQIDGLRAIPVSSLRSDRHTSTQVNRPSDERVRDSGFGFGEDAEPMTRIATEATIEAFYDLLEDENEWIIDANTFLFYDGPSELAADFARLEQQLHRNVQIDISTTVSDLATGGPRTRGQERVWDRLVVPALSSRSAILRRGAEATEVHDYDVEIAEDAEARNPTVRGVFSGMFSTLRLRPDFDGAMRVSIAGDLSEAGEPRRQAIGDEMAGELWLHNVAQSPMLWDGRVELPATIDLGDAFDFGHDGTRLRLRSKVTFR